jgi:serine/threonine-protein kinase
VKLRLVAAVVGVLLLVAHCPPHAALTKLLSAEQTDLPFTGLKDPNGVAVDTNGDVYITDSNTRQVLKLAAGSNRQTELAFTGLNSPEGMAVDAAGNIYVADAMRARVVKLG